MQAKEYRPDIDVLRAIAVLAVVFYHAQIPYFQGGYVGVSIFFVISGYLITSIIKRKLENNTFSFLEFYENRIRRILPALFVMFFLVFLIFSYFAIDNIEIYALRRATKRALFAFSNFHFYLHTGYFDQDVNLIPMLHTWSLAVEEQFYFIIPSLLILFYKYKHSINTLYILYSLTLLSFVASVICIQFDQKFTFYMLPTRAWELLMGSLLAYTKWTPKTQKGKSFCILIGLFLIAYSIIFFGENSFPGFWALFPCVGAFLYIAGCTNYIYIYRKSLCYYILNNKLLIFIGVISYSFYLWHWPILVFFFGLLPKPNYLFLFSLIFLSFIFAIISWYFIERPFRLNPLFKIRRILWPITIISFALLFILTDTISSPLNSSTYPFSYSVHYHKNTEENITLYRNNQINLLFLGDSHARAQYFLMQNLSQKNSISIAFFLSQLKNLSSNSKDLKQINNLWDKIDKIYKTQTINAIFLTYRLPSKLGFFYEKTTFNNQLKHSLYPTLNIENAISKSLEEIILEAKQNGVKDIFIQLPLPEPYKSIPHYAYKMNTILNYSDDEINNKLGESIQDYNKRTKTTFKIYYTIKKKYANVHIIDPRPYFTNTNNTHYIVVKNNHALYYDDDHLSMEGVNLLAPLYQQIFLDIKNNSIKDNY